MQRDNNLKAAVGRSNRLCSGMGLGILLVDEEYPGFPGDVRNPSAFPYPVQYELIKGLNFDILLFNQERLDSMFPALLSGARNLQRLGVRAIVGECGHLSYFQKRLAAELEIPVFLSSLLQTSWARQVIGANRLVGVVVTDANDLSPAQIKAVDIVLDERTKIVGALNGGKCPTFEEWWAKKTDGESSSVVFARAEAELVAVCKEFVDKNPKMGALVLECTGYSPFARAVQRAVDLPVFSFSTLMDFAYSAVVHRDFYGHV